MAGICGSFTTEGLIDRAPAVRMAHSLVHRGPDESFAFDAGNIVMKSASLSLDGTHSTWQPCSSIDGRYVCIADGEFFNLTEIAGKLGPERDANHSVASVIPNLIARYGVSGLSFIDGQFAAAVYDRLENRLILCRDRFGVCPLFFTQHGGTVHFCSELKSLVKSVPADWTLDTEAVDQYFSLGNIVSPVTIVGEVRSIEPGSAYVFAENSRITGSERYWRYGDFRADTTDSDSLLGELEDSVCSRLSTCTEIGSYLSGGLDSTALAVIANQNLSGRLETFSSTVPGSGISERGYQSIVIEQYGLRNHEVTCTPSDVVDRLEESIRHCCSPQRETYNVAAMQLSETARRSGIKAIISGEGADELFYGYDSYLFDLSGHSRDSVDDRNMAMWGRPDFFWEIDWNTVDKRKRRYLNARFFSSNTGREFWRRRLIPHTDGEVAELSLLQMRSLADVHVQLSGHLLGDHGDSMLMKNSVQGRYPFLANSIVDFALRTVDSNKIENFETKAILKDAVRNVVPPRIVARGKQGFSSPAVDLGGLLPACTVERWRSLVDSTGIFNTDNVFEDLGKVKGKWDFALSAVSISFIIDELRLSVAR